MAGRSKPRQSWFALLLVIAAVVLWALQQPQRPPSRPKASPQVSEKSSAPPAGGKTAGKDAPAVGKTGGYETYRNCTLAEARNNDGDSFRVRLPDSRTEEFRLYFVDTPESAFKRYAGGDTNHERIRQQAAEMGGITPEQAVEIGKKGKAFTLGLLAERPFTIHTSWDSPFHDNRFHAHIEVMENGKPAWLHRLLIERGLARIKTKPADLPDGTSVAKEKETLRMLEKEARRKEAGVWGL